MQYRFTAPKNTFFLSRDAEIMRQKQMKSKSTDEGASGSGSSK